MWSLVGSMAYVRMVFAPAFWRRGISRRQKVTSARGSVYPVCETESVNVEAEIKAVAHISVGGSSTILANTLLISNTLDEELGAIGFIEEFGALYRSARHSKHLVHRVAFLDNDWVKRGGCSTDEGCCRSQHRNERGCFDHGGGLCLLELASQK